MNKKLFDIPVLLITFNRPETTCLVFEQIRKLKPTHLYLFSDAPRLDHIDDVDLVETCRCLLNDSQIDWPCQVERWFPETNMGCALGVSSAISWAFESSERLIILEDDYFPQPDFFSFCKSMLEMYRDNERIMHISGAHRSEKLEANDADHIFSLIAETGGWATWKHAWEKYDFWMEQLSDMKSQNHIQRLVRDKHISKYWYERFDQVFEDGKKQNWEVQWQYTLFKNYGLAVVPSTHLVKDISGMLAFSPRNEMSDEPPFNYLIGKQSPQSNGVTNIFEKLTLLFHRLL
ncbi:hypothetical protein [Dyadobacter sp. CY347]|uniref:hypothetical protein n=1 Tax=Dyadobacter sp. CY347 TaxID=2909336 RepID=UPI001F3A83A5|nr:hypothetical protein [Dyadobacter sp. CY347]MCF2487398.1 hypothetical protein [Dyadobacter sp. CY347]